MTRIAWHRLLALGAMVAPNTGRAQAQEAQIPKATVRELATIDGYVDAFVRLPDGRTLIYAVNDSTFVQDVATKRRTLLGTDMNPASVSPRGDRLAFSRLSEDGSGLRLWTIPIDPRTGAATGGAQLASQKRLAAGRRVAFSPEGRTLAFFGAGTQPSGPADLILIPATGGAERVVANYATARSFAWTADGGSLDVVIPGPTRIERITVDGGAKQPLFPHTDVTDQMPVGVSPEARLVIFTNNPDVFLYRTAAGIEGQIEVPLPMLDDGWGRDFSLDDQGRYVTATYLLRNQGVRVLDVQTGRSRSILPNETSILPAWSPDGRRLAVLNGHLSHYDVAIVNADGSGLRRYPLPMNLGNWAAGGAPWERPWSPDGRFLAFFAQNGPRIGWIPGSQRQLAILDVASGATRVLGSTPGAYNTFAWQSDSKTIRVFKRGLGGETGTIVEFELDGTERTLRDISAEFPRWMGVTLTGDREAIVTVRVGGTPGTPISPDQRIDRFLVPLDGGTARRLPDPVIEPGLRNGAMLIAGNRLLIAQVDGRGEVRSARMLSTTGDSTRTVRFPFAGRRAVPSVDGKHFIDASRAVGDSLYTVYLVPLDGSALRIIGRIRDVTLGSLAPSPDGALLAYTSDGLYTSRIHEIDFSPAIQAIVKR